MARSLVHPRLLDSLPQFYPSKCTIQEGIETQSASGSPVTTWATFTGHYNIDCAVSPIYRNAPLEREIRVAELTIAAATHHIALRGYFPSIRSTMRALVSGVGYDIESVEHDSHQKTTRLRARLAEI